MTDQFFRPDGPEVEEWDGEPKVVLTYEETLRLYAFVPQWHGEAIGPKIPFGNGRVKIGIEAIFRETREEAIGSMEFHMQRACEEEGMIFDRDDWRITHLALLNAC